MRILFIFFFFCSSFAFTQIKYSDYFTPETLRLNTIFLTNKQNAIVALHSFAVEKKWVGGEKSLIYPDKGNFKVTLTHPKNNTLIFSKGFSNLAGEWQSSSNAQGEFKSFEQVIHTPMPKEAVVARIYERKNGLWKVIFEQEIRPTDPLLIRETPLKYPTEQIIKATHSEKAVDVVILPEGYTAAQMSKFVADTKKMIDYLFQNNAFKPHKNKFNVTLVKVPSLEEGTDIGGENTFKRTAFHTHFYTFYSERYLTCPALFAAADAAASAGGYDQLFILVNSTKYGGGGFYNSSNVAVSDSNKSREVFVHEFGHGFAGLADEYYDNSDDALNDSFYSLEEEPWEENISTLKNFSSKWANLVHSSTPIPTPREKAYENKVGVFEGGGYSSKGIYSPVQKCMMKDLHANFCPVCTRSIARTIDFLTQ